MNKKDLHITIAASPKVESGNPKMLENDLRLVKASILYADRVRLYSPITWMATSFHLISNEFSIAQQFDFLMQIAPSMAQNNQSLNLLELEKIHKLFKRNPITLTKKEKLKIARFKELFPSMWKDFREGVNDYLSSMGFGEIQLLASKGLLELQPFTAMDKKDMNEYLSSIVDILESSETHPMLDEEISNLVRLALEEGVINVGKSGTRKTKQVGLVADLFDRLPVFDIEIDELLDVRDELSKPLVNFRAEMMKLSGDIENAVWDKYFSADVQNVYQAKIEPALVEIEDKLKSTTFREFWTKRVVDKYGFIAGSLGASYALGAAVTPVAGIAAALTSAAFFTEAGFSELREKVSEIERNGLYFYYRVKSHAENLAEK